MIGTLFLVSSYVISPPIRPTSTGGEGGWKIVAVDMQTASELLTKFSRSFDGSKFDADFSCNPIQDTKTPQGILGMMNRRNGEIDMLLHYLEKTDGVAQISSVATPCDVNPEVTSVFIDCLKNSASITLDYELIRDRQPKWHCIIQYHWNSLT